MRLRLTYLALAAALLAAVPPASLRAYTTYARWAAGSAVFFINPANADVASSAAITAIRSAMQAWTDQPGASFRFDYGGTSTVTATVNDGRNVALFRSESNGSTLATTYSWWNGSKQLIDSDIIFWDGGVGFFTGTTGCGGTQGAYLEDIATHELGHALGLNHSTDAAATMYPRYSYCSQAFRTLAADDLNGLKSLYPGATPVNTAPTVAISSPVNGASVVDGTLITFSGAAADTQDGALTSALQWTDNGTAIGAGGSFTRALPVGVHTITASVTDSGGLRTSQSVTVTVTAAPSATLTGRTRTKKGYQYVDLKWTGITGVRVDVYRNGAFRISTSNDGAHTDLLGQGITGTYVYKVCTTGTTLCTPTVSTTF